MTRARLISLIGIGILWIIITAAVTWGFIAGNGWEDPRRDHAKCQAGQCADHQRRGKDPTTHAATHGDGHGGGEHRSHGQNIPFELADPEGIT